MGRGSIIPFGRPKATAIEAQGSANGAPPALKLQGVSLAAPLGRLLIHPLDLAVAEGERVAIIGPNGAGKTSLLRLLCGRAAPTSGQVWFRGRPLSDLSLRERALTMAVVTQCDTPDLRLTLRDYVALGRLPHRGRMSDAIHGEVVDHALERVGLSALAARRLETLSGGERQRGAIGRAIAQQPRILLLDEPTNHLDPRARADVLALARDLGITVVAVLHDLTLVSAFADRVVVLDRGTLVASAPPSVALSPRVVRDVFDLDCFETVNPETGRPLLVFDTPSPPERHDDALPSTRLVGPVRLRPGAIGARLSGHP